MKPNAKWIDDWPIGVKPSREDEISIDLLDFFIKRGISGDGLNKTAYELLSEYVDPDYGPLIYHDNEDW